MSICILTICEPEAVISEVKMFSNPFDLFEYTKVNFDVVEEDFNGVSGDEVRNAFVNGRHFRFNSFDL